MLELARRGACVTGNYYRRACFPDSINSVRRQVHCFAFLLPTAGRAGLYFRGLPQLLISPLPIAIRALPGRLGNEFARSLNYEAAVTRLGSGYLGVIASLESSAAIALMPGRRGQRRNHPIIVAERARSLKYARGCPTDCYQNRQANQATPYGTEIDDLLRASWLDPHCR